MEFSKVGSFFLLILINNWFSKVSDGYNTINCTNIISMMNEDLENLIPFMFNSGIISLLQS